MITLLCIRFVTIIQTVMAGLRRGVPGVPEQPPSHTHTRARARSQIKQYLSNLEKRNKLPINGQIEKV